MALFAAGLVILVAGAEVLIRGAVKLAAALRIPPLIIGLTVVAFGTSAPELAVSIQSALGGSPDIALGNVVGSNIFNVLFILGLSALVAPLAVSRRLIWFDVPVMIAVSGVMYALARDGHVSRLDGAILLAGVLLYTLVLIVTGRREVSAESAGSPPVPEAGAVEVPDEVTGKGLLLSVVAIAVGLGMLVLGARWCVDGAVEIARYFGASELVIGLTIVAAGTSLPELATSVVASLRGQREIAVGNVVGSCIFNLLAVLGATSAVAADGVGVAPAALAFDIPVMMAVAVACLPIFFTGHTIARWEGLLFLAYYAAYTGYLILNAQHAAFLDSYSTLMLWFVLPLTAVTLVVLFVRGLRDRKSAG